MAHDDDDDLYDEEFDFVDDDDVEEDDVEEVAEDESSVDDSDLADERSDMRDVDADPDTTGDRDGRSERNGRNGPNGRNQRGGRRNRTEARDTREPREPREPREEYGSDEAAEDHAGDEPGEQDESGEPQEDEYGRTAPAANYVVHVYEAKRFHRTIDRPFTPEDAEAFATEFNRTGKNYSRWAVTAKNDAPPKKTLD